MMAAANEDLERQMAAGPGEAATAQLVAVHEEVREHEIAIRITHITHKRLDASQRQLPRKLAYWHARGLMQTALMPLSRYAGGGKPCCLIRHAHRRRDCMLREDSMSPVEAVELGGHA